MQQDNDPKHTNHSHTFATHKLTNFQAPQYALPATFEHSPNEMVDDVLKDSLPDLNQGISDLLNSL